MDDTDSVVYTTSQTHAVVILVLVSCISMAAVVGLLLAISLSAYNTRTSTDRNMFVRTHVAAYFLSLLCSDLLQGIGSVMNERWIRQQMVTYDNFCIAQAVIKEAADVGTALWSLVIAIHTFCIIFLRMKMPPYSLWVTLLLGWGAVAGIVMAGPLAYYNSGHGSFYGISGPWCWISDGYANERITLDYLVMFVSVTMSFILYSLVFLRLQGKIIINGWHVTLHLWKRSSTWRGREVSDNRTMMIAKQMLLYPIAYTIIILPITAARFSSWSGHNVPFAVTILCDAVFLCSGVVNVTLFITTRRILPPDSILRKPLVKSTASEMQSEICETDPESQPEKVSLSIPFDALTIANLPRRPDSAASPVSTVSTVHFQTTNEHTNTTRH